MHRRSALNGCFAALAMTEMSVLSRQARTALDNAGEFRVLRRIEVGARKGDDEVRAAQTFDDALATALAMVRRSAAAFALAETDAPEIRLVACGIRRAEAGRGEED